MYRIGFVIFVIILFIIYFCLIFNEKENFDGTGMVFNVPPNWFIKKDYDINDWIVNYDINSIQPSCLPYSKASKYGSLDNVNYLSSAYRFWRF